MGGGFVIGGNSFPRDRSYISHEDPHISLTEFSSSTLHSMYICPVSVIEIMLHANVYIIIALPGSKILTPFLFKSLSFFMSPDKLNSIDFTTNSY
jgi:hypothetical protein